MWRHNDRWDSRERGKTARRSSRTSLPQTEWNNAFLYMNSAECIVYIVCRPVKGFVHVNPASRSWLILKFNPRVLSELPVMELFCHEHVELDSSSQIKSRPVRAFRDAVLTQDSRVHQNLLSSERPNIIKPGTEQTDVQPYMRRILTGWMLQVSRYQIWILNSNHTDLMMSYESYSDSLIRIKLINWCLINPIHWFESFWIMTHHAGCSWAGVWGSEVRGGGVSSGRSLPGQVHVPESRAQMPSAAAGNRLHVPGLQTQGIGSSERRQAVRLHRPRRDRPRNPGRSCDPDHHFLALCKLSS